MPTKKKTSEAKEAVKEKKATAPAKKTVKKETAPPTPPEPEKKPVEKQEKPVEKTAPKAVAETKAPETKAPETKAPINKTEPQQPVKAAAAQDDPLLHLAGYLQGWCEQGLNVSLNEVPDEFKVINIQYATLDNYAVVRFDPCSTNINIPELREVQKQKKIKVMLTVGGPDGNFGFLNSSGNVTNFYNSLWTLYQSWGFDGITFDIQQLDKKNRQFVIDGIRKFKERCPESLISIAAQPTYVCPPYDNIGGVYNQLVPVIAYEKQGSGGAPEFIMKEQIDFIQVLAYNYGDAYDKLRSKATSPPTEIPPDATPEMLEFIFNSYVSPFTVTENTPGSEPQTFNYPGYPADKIYLGVIAFQSSIYTDYVAPDDVKTALNALTQKAGATVFNINYDAQTNYSFTNAIK